MIDSMPTCSGRKQTAGSGVEALKARLEGCGKTAADAESV